MEVFNVIVGDVGKKSVQVGTLFLDKSRKAPLSGYLSKDAISKALADGTVSTKVADPRASRFLQGHQTFRVAAFPIQKRETQESKGL